MVKTPLEWILRGWDAVLGVLTPMDGFRLSEVGYRLFMAIGGGSQE